MDAPPPQNLSNHVSHMWHIFSSLFLIGENGSPVKVDKDKLTSEELADLEDGYKDYSFNRFISDKISIHRSLPDIRNDR